MHLIDINMCEQFLSSLSYHVLQEKSTRQSLNTISRRKKKTPSVEGKFRIGECVHFQWSIFHILFNAPQNMCGVRIKGIRISEGLLYFLQYHGQALGESLYQFILADFKFSFGEVIHSTWRHHCAVVQCSIELYVVWNIHMHLPFTNLHKLWDWKLCSCSFLWFHTHTHLLFFHSSKRRH